MAPPPVDEYGTAADIFLQSLAHSRLQAIDPEQYDWQHEDILKSFSGEIKVYGRVAPCCKQ